MPVPGPTVESARDLLTALALSAWNAAAPGKPVLYDNLPDRPPRNFGTAGIWGRIHVQHDGGDRAGIVGPQRARGQLFVQVFVPVGSSTKLAEETATKVRDAIVAAHGAGPVWLRDVGVRDVGPDGTFYQVNVEAKFTYDF